MTRSVALALLSFAVASCSLYASPSPTFQEGTERLPGPGYFHVIGDPAVAEAAFVVRNFGEDGEESGVSDSFRVGQSVELDGARFTGQVGLTVDGTRCDGRFPVVPERVTEVVLHIDADGCRVTVVTVHDVEAP